MAMTMQEQADFVGLTEQVGAMNVVLAALLAVLNQDVSNLKTRMKGSLAQTLQNNPALAQSVAGQTILARANHYIDSM